MKSFFLIIIAFVLSLEVYAQPVFFKQFGNPSSNSACFKVIESSDGAIITCGYEISMGDAYGYSGRRIFLTKFSHDGNLIWSKTVGSGTETAYDIMSTSDGGYIIVGCTADIGDGSSANLNDAFALKTDSGLNVQWTKKYTVPSIANVFRTVTTTAQGDFIFAGATTGLAGGGFNIAVVKTNSLGDTLWTRSFGTTAFDMILTDAAYDIVSSDDGGCLIVGQIGVEDIWNRYFPFVFKISPTGNVEWRQLYYGSTSSDYGYSITSLEDNNFALLCKSHIIKINATGDIIWSRKLPSGWSGDYSNNPYNTIGTISATNNGGMIVCGRHNLDACLIKLDGNGNLEWAKSYDNGRSEMAASVIQLPSGQFVVGGLSRDGLNIENSFLMVTDIFGNLGTCATIRNYAFGTETEIAYPVTPIMKWCYDATPLSFIKNEVSPSHFIINTSCSEDYTNMEEVNANSALLIYPNPTSDNSIIEFSEPTKSSDVLQVVSTHGNIIKTIFVPVGQLQLTIPVNDLSAGIYFITYRSGNGKALVNKLVISK
jgi:hypothetical protein